MQKLSMETGGEFREKEREPIARLSMDMARHSIKGSKPRESLTPQGMEAAVTASLEKGRELPFGDIFGSPRERTGQSSMVRMFAEQFKDIDFREVDPEDIVRWLEEGGLQKTESPLLNFQSGEGEYAEEQMDNFRKGRYFAWLSEESDKKALESKQSPDKVTPLSVQAGNVAAFIFARVWEAYDRLDKGERIEPKMDFITSHKGVLESFLYKIIKQQEDEKAAHEFVEDLKGDGFAENQGFNAEILIYNKDDVRDWVVKISYKDKEYLIKSEEITDIINEGEELKNELKQRSKK